MKGYIPHQKCNNKVREKWMKKESFSFHFPAPGHRNEEGDNQGF